MADCTVVQLHPTPKELQQLVADTLTEPRRASIERHTRLCGSCAARLQREALLEAVLFEAAKELERAPAAYGQRWRLGWLSGVSAAVASIAAVLAVVVFQPTDDSATLGRAAASVQAEPARTATPEPEEIPWTVDPLMSIAPPVLAAAGPMCGPDGSTLVESEPADPETSI
jgi:hypothetical protein